MGKFDIPPKEIPKSTPPVENPVATGTNVNEKKQDLLKEVSEMIERKEAWKVWVEQASTGKVEHGNKEGTEPLNCFQIEKRDDGSFSTRFVTISMGIEPDAIKETGNVNVTLHSGVEKDETVWKKEFANAEDLKKFLPEFLKDKFPDGAIIKNTDNRNM